MTPPKEPITVRGGESNLPASRQMMREEQEED